MSNYHCFLKKPGCIPLQRESAAVIHVTRKYQLLHPEDGKEFEKFSEIYWPQMQLATIRFSAWRHDRTEWRSRMRWSAHAFLWCYFLVWRRDLRTPPFDRICSGKADPSADRSKPRIEHELLFTWKYSLREHLNSLQVFTLWTIEQSSSDLHSSYICGLIAQCDVNLI